MIEENKFLNLVSGSLFFLNAACHATFFPLLSYNWQMTRMFYEGTLNHINACITTVLLEQDLYGWHKTVKYWKYSIEYQSY
jgi:hypothetical protein